MILALITSSLTLLYDHNLGKEHLDVDWEQVWYLIQVDYQSKGFVHDSYSS